jgi:hypothetical protein
MLTVMLDVILLIVIMPSVILPYASTLYVIMLNVMAPFVLQLTWPNFPSRSSEQLLALVTGFSENKEILYARKTLGNSL